MLTYLPENISTYGGDIDGVMSLIGWITLAWLLLAEGLLLYFLLRYRKKKEVRARWLPADTLRTNAWILVPALLVTIFDMHIEVESAGVWKTVKEDLPAHEQLVRITGRQFVWSFTYAGPDGVLDTDDDFTTINEMVVPRGEVVRFQLESLDVLHSFWVPVLRLKQDAVPGRSIPGWFEATKEGDYEIACAELCGAGHTVMKAQMRVVPPGRYAEWEAVQFERQGTAQTKPSNAKEIQ